MCRRRHGKPLALSAVTARTPTCQQPLLERAMDNGIQLISDGDGLAVLGSEADVERFLVSEGLSSKDLGVQRFRSAVGIGAVAAQVGSDLAANSGRWVKLTPKSARLVEKYGLRESAKTGFSTGVVKGQKGQIKGFVEFVKGPRSLLSNPAVLANAAKLMSQVAMQQSMDEITDYSRHDRREGRRRAARPEGRGARPHDRNGLRRRGGHDHPPV
jgi:hypothetical protein